MIIGEAEIKELYRLKKYAEENILSFDDLLDIKNGDRPPPGRVKEFGTVIPFEYYVVFTIEEQPQAGVFKKFRHLSVSVGDIVTKGVFPSPAAVKGIMGMLGFTTTNLEELYKVYIEQEIAVNVMELYETTNTDT